MAVILLTQIPGHPCYGASLLEAVINTALPALHAPILQQKLVYIRIGYGFLYGDRYIPRRGRQVNDDSAQLCRFRRTVRTVRLGNGIKGKLFTGIPGLCAVLEQAAPCGLQRIHGLLRLCGPFLRFTGRGIRAALPPEVKGSVFEAVQAVIGLRTAFVAAFLRRHAL